MRWRESSGGLEVRVEGAGGEGGGSSGGLEVRWRE